MTARFRLMVLLICLFSLLVGGCSSRADLSQEEARREKVPAFSRQEQSSPSAPVLLKIHFIDIGQGDAILIQSPQGENLLIDAGEKDAAPKLLSYLEAQGVEKLAAVIGTHPHSDHIGGLSEVINTFPVARVYLPAVTHNSRTFEELLLTIKNKELKVSKASQGVKIPLNGLQAVFLAPGDENYEKLNNYSAVVELRYGENTFLLMGDAEIESEEQILQAYSDLKANVIKLGHHGSSSSSSPAFLAAVAPQYAIVMCGADNEYGHPHQETLAALKKMGIEVCRTDQDGNILISCDGRKVDISSERGNNISGSPKPQALNDKTSVAVNDESKDLIGNKKTRKFHRPDCKTLPEMQNRIFFSNREQAIAQGYTPCKSCNP
ncbi:MAG: MBL fold metallo-hydrolase [Syntrophomonadaceae bacterium]|nr:MBL fold metallo-hydrolase [Syntrophomonadaceae bacterium]MDD3022442.1 MBL fold metallo-hydrolase [Syntrophomonadaceae bacterium]